MLTKIKAISVKSAEKETKNKFFDSATFFVQIFYVEFL